MTRYRYPIIFAAACLVYANTLFNELVFDDRLLILEQTAIRNPLDLGSIWLGRFWGEIWPHNVLYRPLTLWTLGINYGFNSAIGLPGEHTFLYHLVNVLLHAAVSLLVMVFASRLGLSERVSAAAALLFALHPIHTEAVAMITARSELLASGFGLAFLLMHRDRRLTPATVCLFMALCSKESSIAFLPLAVLIDVLTGRVTRDDILRYGLPGAVVVIWLLIRQSVISGIVPPAMTLPLSEVSVVERVLTAAHIQVKYLILLVYPVNLSSDYSFNQIPIVDRVTDPFVVVFIAALIGSTILAWRFRYSCPIVTISLAGYAILFTPASNFLLAIGTVMGERLAYAPSIFVCILGALALDRLVERRPSLGRAAIILVSTVFAFLTISRNATWADPDVFARAQLESAPNSAKANYNAARSFHTRGDLQRAVSLYKEALRIKPLYPDAWNNYGVAMRDEGDIDAAVSAARQALAIEPEHARAHFNLGLALEDLGRAAEAEAAYRGAIRIDVGYPEANNNLAMILAERGHLDSAAVLWKKALERRPDYEIAMTNLDRLEAAMRNKAR